MKKKDRELADGFERRRQDPARLRRNAASVEVKRPSSHVVSVRLPTGEFLGLMDGVEASGEKVGDYVRGAIQMRLALERTTRGAADIMADALKDVKPEGRKQWSGNPLPYRTHRIPDFPPKGVADPL